MGIQQPQIRQSHSDASGYLAATGAHGTIDLQREEISMFRRLALMIGVVALGTALLAPTVAGKASTDRIEDFDTVLAVSFDENFPLASLMRADCAFVQRVERPDGSARETMSCELSSEPVMIPAFQGVPPDEAVIYGGGPCIWFSDYWWNKAGLEVYAESFRVVVTPAGKVHTTTTYPAQPLDCG